MTTHSFIKGKFKGKCTGKFSRSAESFVQFSRLKIIEGDLTVSQKEIEPLSEFTDVVTFPVHHVSDMKVTLQYLDGSFKYFRLKIRELKLINCRLINLPCNGSKTCRVIEGDIYGYLLHDDVITNEIVEENESFDLKDKMDNGSSNSGPVNGSPLYNPSEKPIVISLISLLSKLMLLAGIFTILKHPWLLVLFLLITLLSFSSVYNLLSRISGFRLSNNSATFLFMLLFCITTYCLVAEYLADSGSYGQVAEKTYKGVSAINNSNSLSDSFKMHFDAANVFVQRNQKELAIGEFEKASVFADIQRRKLILIEVTKIYNIQAKELVESGKDKDAIELYSKLLMGHPSNLEYLYKRAKCYLGMGKIKSAVNDLKQAISLGDKASKLLHDKINPVKRRIAYYVTMCCDSTISGAKGSGACSHHKGVCDWNYPIYEDYRQY